MFFSNDMISSLLKKVFMFTREVNENISYTAFRIVVSFLFIQHGLAKYIEFPLSMTNGNGSQLKLLLYISFKDVPELNDKNLIPNPLT